MRKISAFYSNYSELPTFSKFTKHGSTSKIVTTVNSWMTNYEPFSHFMSSLRVIASWKAHTHLWVSLWMLWNYIVLFSHMSVTLTVSLSASWDKSTNACLISSTETASKRYNKKTSSTGDAKGEMLQVKKCLKVCRGYYKPTRTIPAGFPYKHWELLI